MALLLAALLFMFLLGQMPAGASTLAKPIPWLPVILASSGLNAFAEGVGDFSVKLPADMGVQVTAATGIGKLTSSGLRRDSDNYINDAFGEAAYTLYLDIGAGIGAIELLGQ